ncbi:MAG: CHAT domain-containing protein [Polaribacter sp.]|uniref:CHAT domain-containing protein n=1 Tax=Polaribacter sp. TaxID=1920175 RepID=UPI003BB156E3
MFKISRLLIIFFFLFLQLTFSQEVNKNLLIEKESFADSIYFNHSQYSKKETLEKAIFIYDDLLEGVKDSLSEKFKKILAKKYAVKGFIKIAELQKDSAYPYLKKSITLQEQITTKDNFLKGHVYRQMYLYWGLTNKQDSIIYYTEKAEESLKDTLGLYHRYISEAMYERARALGRKGKRREEIALSRKAIANNIAYQGEINQDVAIQEHILANVYDHIGYSKKELESYKKVIQIWESMPNHKDMSYLNIAYTSTCMWYLLYGDIEKAEQYLLKSERLLKDRKQDIPGWFNETFKGRAQLGSWYYRGQLAAHKKDTLDALNYANKILTFVDNFDKTKKQNNPFNLSYFYEFVKNFQMKTLRFKADLIRSQNPHQSKLLSDKILKVNDKMDFFTLVDQLQIIDYYIKYDSINKANYLINKSIKGGKKNKDAYSLIHLYAKKGDLLLQQKKYKELNEVYKTLFKQIQRDTTKNIAVKHLIYQNVKPYGAQSILDILLKISANYTTLYQKNNDANAIKNAYSVIKLASEIFSKNFNLLRHNQQKYITTTKINEQLLAVTILENSISKNEILEVIEESGSKTIWNKFFNSQQRKHLNIPDSILQKEEELLAELYIYKKQLYLDKETDINLVNTYKENILSVTNQIEETEEWLQNNYPTYYNQKVKKFKIDALKKQLKPNQKVIKYLFTDKNVYAFIITKKETKLVFIGDKKNVSEKIKPLARLLTKPNEIGYKEKAKEVYQLLISKLNLSKKKEEELIFIQDDVLNYIPMEALVNSENKYLIQFHKVSYAPSLTLLNGQINAKKSSKNKVGIYAPTYKKYKKESPKRDESSALFGASVEASKIANIFSATSFIGDKANKKQFLKDAENYNMLHLAMHSSFNNVDSEFSSLNFSSQNKDDKLFVSELYNISLNADLVVLSACNTGSGELKKGEGLVNVSRAFTYAGVPSLVASLWAVPDLETSEIMVDFYKQLKQGKSKNEALQIAKLNYLNNAEYTTLKHPFYWSGFVVSGDVSAINSSFNYFWVIVLLPIFLLIFLRKKLLKLF